MAIARVVMVAVALTLIAAAAAIAFGSFKPVKSIPTGGWTYGVVAADLNRDGHADIVAANDGTSDDHVSVLYGKGNGTFRPEQRLIAGYAGPEGVAVADLNGDRRKDIAAVNYGTSTVALRIQTRSGKFRLGDTLPAGSGAWLIAAGDLNRDGKADIVTGNYDSSGPKAVSVLLGKGGGAFRSHRDYTASGKPYGLLIGRINGDKRPDVVAVDTAGTASVLLTRRNGTLAPAINRTITPWVGDTYDPTLGDFNRDGKLDLAIGSYSSAKALVLLGIGNGHLRSAKDSDLGGLKPNGMAAGDFNRDGKLDLAVGVFNSPWGFAFLPGRGDGSFGAPQPHAGTSSVQTVSQANLNSDKALDVLIGTDKGVEVFLNKR
ncbi:MAG: VCBS repeat-containing protein [Solirubrobacterales bacterium]